MVKRVYTMVTSVAAMSFMYMTVNRCVHFSCFQQGIFQKEAFSCFCIMGNEVVEDEI